MERVSRLFSALGERNKGYVAFVWISSREYMGHIRKLGLPFVPGVLFCDAAAHYKQLLDVGTSILDEAALTAFVDSALDCSGTLFVKSMDADELAAARDEDARRCGKERAGWTWSPSCSRRGTTAAPSTPCSKASQSALQKRASSTGLTLSLPPPTRRPSLLQRFILTFAMHVFALRLRRDKSKMRCCLI